jgi:hypothetical protein
MGQCEVATWGLTHRRELAQDGMVLQVEGNRATHRHQHVGLDRMSHSDQEIEAEEGRRLHSENSGGEQTCMWRHTDKPGRTGKGSSVQHPEEVSCLDHTPWAQGRRAFVEGTSCRRGQDGAGEE